jgi:Zn-dependent protease
MVTNKNSTLNSDNHSMEHSSKEKKGVVGTILAAILAAFKWGILIVSKVEFLGVFLSMVVSIVAYSLIFGWWFAVGFVLLLLIHELGHVVQLRREGVPASAPLFIPFLGAVINMKRLPNNAGAEARVGIAGPIAGTLATLIPLTVYLISGSHLFQGLAYIGFFLNCFNLFPILPLDGGRVMAALSPRMWYVGFASMLVLALLSTYFRGPGNSFILYLILLMGFFELKRRRTRGQGNYFQVPARQRIQLGLLYIFLLLGTGWGTVALYVHRSL